MAIVSATFGANLVLIVILTLLASILVWWDDWYLLAFRARRRLAGRVRGVVGRLTPSTLEMGERFGEPSPRVRWVVFGVATLGAFLLTAVVFDRLLAVFVAPLVGFFVQRKVVAWLIGRRVRRLERQTLTMVRLLYSILETGEAPFQALRWTMREVDDPLQEELRFLVERAEAGVPLAAVIRETVRRTTCRDLARALRILAQAQEESLSAVVTIQRLRRLDETLRARHRLREKLSAMVAQTTTGQYIVTALIPASLFFSYLISPKQTSLLFTTTIGKIALGAIVLDVLLVHVLIRRILATDSFDY